MDGLEAYELIDCGEGRRLERFGERVVDRPAPTATDPSGDRAVWRNPDLRFQRGVGWTGPKLATGPWTARLERLVFELRPTEAGQVGFFPEQRPLRSWVAAEVAQRSDPVVLNLFGYTGAATLAAAGAGARVVHVDAARPTVAWARHNAELSNLADRPIRWLIDDAEAFLGREARRGRRYDGIVLDPPTYGHGPGGRAWRLDERLNELLTLVADVAARDGFVVLTAHTPGLGPDELREALASAFRRTADAGRLELRARSGAVLPLGAWARIMAGQ